MVSPIFVKREVKMYTCKFVITQVVDDKTKAPTHFGIFSILKIKDTGDELVDKWKALSGGWGKGPLEEGDYTCYPVKPLPNDKAHAAFSSEGSSWVMSLFPLFKTSRFDLAVHPDGNLPGTLGCIGILNRTKDCFDKLKECQPGKLSVIKRIINEN